MKKRILSLNWKELFFPVLADLKDINEETDTTRVSNNNWKLANDKADFDKILDLIKENRSSEDSGHNLIILE